MPRTTRLRSLPTSAAVAVSILVVAAGVPASAGAERPAGQPRSVSAADPAGDATRSGTLEPLLGPADLYAASDLTGVRASVDATAYTLEVGVVDAFTGGSDILVLTGEVVYDVVWRTVNRRGVVSEVPERVRVSASASGVNVETTSLPPRCRNDEGLSVSLSGPSSAYAAEDPVAGAVLTVVVPRACAKGTSGVVRGAGDVRATARGDAPGGSLLLGSYVDRARLEGVAVASRR